MSRSILIVMLLALGCASKVAPKPTVKIEQHPGSPPRAEIAEFMIGVARFVEPADFLAALDKSEASVREFAALKVAPAEPEHLLASYTTWNVRARDLRRLVQQTVEQIKDAPSIYFLEDVFGYPRLLVVWQYRDFHKQLWASANNDNHAVSFMAVRGTFAPNGTGLTLKKTYSKGTDPLSAMSFLADATTIYPHIENYFLCAPECETR